MRCLAIGDIHGCFRALTTLADVVPIRDDDLVVTLGDYVNRGPDSRSVLEWLIERHGKGKLVPLRGNHEIMMLQAREDPDRLRRWLYYGGTTTLASYQTDDTSDSLDLIPEAHWQFLEQETRGYYETASHIFVHATLHPDIALAEQPELYLHWEKFNDPPPHYSGKVMVCGHTSQKLGLPRSVGHAVCIDTWAYGDGWLTCLDTDTGQYWQANQQGETRSEWLTMQPPAL